MYSQLDVKPCNSSHWKPPGYITRKERDEAHLRMLNKENTANGLETSLSHQESSSQDQEKGISTGVWDGPHPISNGV